MVKKYLQRYAEPEARAAQDDPPGSTYNHGIVIPAYRENPQLANRLQQIARRQDGLLIILVLNQPDTDIELDTNAPLRDAIAQSTPLSTHPYGTLYQFQGNSHLLLIERSQALPASEGVGLARKIGCDIALALFAQGVVKSRWLHTTDADAILPDAYFHSAESLMDYVAIAHPFHHRLSTDPRLACAIYLYELRLHYYVLGLEWAGSPYAFHTLGSCISVAAQSYAAVRGFPRRSGGEDFYLLNKVAKLGPVATDVTPTIELEGRVSDRVPFGTGPAVAKLLQSAEPAASPLFYHPHSFRALKTLLDNLELLYLDQTLIDGAPNDPIAIAVLKDLGIEKALAHCSRHSKDFEGWRKHFHQWFDGFRTLKFIHGLRDAGLADMDLAASRAHRDSLWPVDWQFDLVE
jgi:hypothetical protein